MENPAPRKRFMPEIPPDNTWMLVPVCQPMKQGQGALADSKGCEGVLIVKNVRVG